MTGLRNGPRGPGRRGPAGDDAGAITARTPESHPGPGESNRRTKAPPHIGERSHVEPSDQHRRDDGAADAEGRSTRTWAQVQEQISTGKAIGSAKDNAAVWAISKVMESDVKGFKEISDSLALGESTVAVARDASETITDLLTDIKGKIVAAQEENVDRDKIQTDIEALTKQIGSVVGAAQFNGLNLIDGSSEDVVNVLSSLDRSADGKVKASSIEVGRQNLSTTTPTTAVAFGGTAVTDSVSRHRLRCQCRCRNGGSGRRHRSDRHQQRDGRVQLPDHAHRHRGQRPGRRHCHRRAGLRVRRERQ